MSLINYIKDFILKRRKSDSAIKIVFDNYFFDLKYYLHQDASKENFAKFLNISIEKLEQITDSYYRLSFDALINETRYKHFIIELESPYNKNLPLETIIKICGFENNNTFSNFVKERQANK